MLERRAQELHVVSRIALDDVRDPAMQAPPLSLGDPGGNRTTDQVV